jgi:hypothetical protein
LPRVIRRWRLPLLLTIELLAAGAARWPLTTSDIRTQFEYQLGQVVITSENWRREGALARHLIPTRSTDHRLSEWPYYDQDYITVPPLSFALHYAAVNVFRRADPVVVAKLVAQVQIAAGVLVAAVLFERTLGVWPTLAGFSLLIWTLPFLVWYINGYFPTTTALLVQLIGTGWMLQCVRRWASGHGPAASLAHRRRPAVAAAALAALGVCSEAIGLAVNAAVAVVFAAIGAASLRAKRRDARAWFGLAAATSAATLVTLAAIVALYATRTEFSATFADRFSDRAGLKTGRAPIVEHAHTIFMQMRTAWPKPLVLAFAGAAIALAVWYTIEWWCATGVWPCRSCCSASSATWRRSSTPTSSSSAVRTAATPSLAAIVLLVVIGLRALSARVAAATRGRRQRDRRRRQREPLRQRAAPSADGPSRRRRPRRRAARARRHPAMETARRRRTGRDAVWRDRSRLRRVGRRRRAQPAAALRVHPSDGDFSRAGEIAIVGSEAHPSSIALRQFADDLRLRTDDYAQLESCFVNRLRKGPPLATRSEYIALARTVRVRGWRDVKNIEAIAPPDAGGDFGEGRRYCASRPIRRRAPIGRPATPS